MTDITDALTDLNNELKGASDPAQTLADIADDYGVKAPVLRARFEAAAGCTIETYAARDHKAPEIAKRTNALEEAEKLASEFNGRHPVFGKVFTFEGEKFIAVVLSSNHPKFFLRAVRCSDGRRWGFTRGVYNTRLAHMMKEAA